MLSTEKLQHRLSQPNRKVEHLHGANPHTLGELIPAMVEKNSICPLGTVIKILDACINRLNRSVQHLETRANHYQSEFERLDAIINPPKQARRKTSNAMVRRTKA